MGTSKKLSGKVMGYLILIGLVVLSWLIFKILTPHNFGSFSNMLNYFQASLIATVGAVGFYFVMVMGMFDFSIGANIMLSAIVGCVFATRFNMGYLGLIIGCVLTGAIVGILNGIFYVKLRIPSMIVTTGLALIYESIANYIAGGVEQTLPANIRAFGQMPWDIILALVACVVAYIFLNYTKIGTYTYAIGSDEFVAKNMGINVNKTISITFAIGSGLAAIAGLLLCQTYPTLTPYTGAMPGIKAFVAAVFGGIGSIPGAMVGGILLGIIEIFGKAYISSQVADAIVFAVLIVVLLVKPTGLFGKNIQEKV